MRLPLDLPKPSFRRIDDELSRKPSTHVDALARSFGYRNGDGFQRPDHYIRHIEPLEEDLLRQVEYDMDEQDFDWLQALNAERRKEQHGPVSQEIFEVIMDQLEKEWFTLMKRVPKPDMDLPPEDSCCAVCDDGEGENSNAIVFCDGCNLAVHQDCYGVPYIPEGQWLCRKCTVSPEVPVTCILCPNEGGAFKQTSSGKWAHLLCAIWIPEVTVQSQVFMEPIEHIENIQKSRWKLRCSLCKEPKGACIQCDIKSCYAAFHVSCARKQKFLCSMKTMPGQDEQPLRAFCERHLPPDMAELRTAYFKDREERAEEIAKLRQSSKAARAYARTYKTGPPLVPQYIVDRVMSYIAKVQLRKKPHVVLSVCKYWSLKREARRGAPLLKRLHLEPWTTATPAALQTQEVRLAKLEHYKRLRHQLSKLRDITEYVQKRESVKTEQTQNAVMTLNKLLFPHEAALQDIFRQISRLDEKDTFRVLQPKNEAPEYYDQVKYPMCWRMIEEKLDAHEYWDPDTFKTDIELIWDNPIAFYPPEHELYHLAERIRRLAAPILSSIANIPRSEEEGGSSTTFEPTTDAVQSLLDGKDGENERSLLSTLLSTLGDPSIPAVDALIRQNVQMKPISSRSMDAEPATNGRSSPRKKKEPSTPQNPSRQPGISMNGATPITEASLSRHLAETGAFPFPRHHMDGASSVAGSERKRKRDEYEGPADHQSPTRNHTQNGVPSSPTRKGSSPQRKKVTLSEDVANASADSPPKLTKAQKKEIARQKERERRARRKAEAEAAAATAATATAGPQDTAQDTAAEGFTVNRREGSSSPLTDLDDDNDGKGDNEVQGQGNEANTTTEADERRATRRKVSKKDSRPSLQRKPSRLLPRRNPTTTSVKSDSKIDEKELPVGFILQIGAGTRKNENRTDRVKKENVMGDPPELDERGLMEDGTLVWAKQEGHPWFPAVVFEPDDESIPDRIHQTKQWFCDSANLTEEEQKTVQIVQFLDSGGTWAWLAPKSIRLLFDEKRDKYLLNARFRNPTLKAQVRSAYARAQYEREIEPAEEGGEEEDGVNEETDKDGQLVESPLSHHSPLISPEGEEQVRADVTMDDPAPVAP